MNNYVFRRLAISFCLPDQRVIKSVKLLKKIIYSPQSNFSKLGVHLALGVISANNKKIQKVVHFCKICRKTVTVYS